ncbi:hypothetical protein [Streptomyces sp. NPDC047043]|uniref:hypothetical protein n=1 Tax=Streptomyces sp. NPDC047043 TaxID=3154497 RepID=UPI0033D7FA75
MNRNDDTTAGELEEQRQAQVDRRHGDYGDCDPVAAEVPAADSLIARWVERMADRHSQG